MKFNLRYLANLFVAALLFCATGCKDDDTSGPEMPAVKIAPGATTASSISFTATPEYADAAAYVCVEKGMLIPSAENILANGTALTLDKESLVEVKNLKDTTVYVVAAAAKMGDQIGNVVSVEIKTGAYENVLTVVEAGKSVISYHVKPSSDSKYYHLAIPKAYWDYQLEGLSDSEAETVKTAMLKQLGSVDKGEKTFTLTDNEVDASRNLMQVFPNTEYLVIKSDCDATGNLTGSLDTLSLKTAENTLSTATITVELSRILSSGATIRFVPGALLNRYFIGIEEKAVIDQYIDKYGEEAWKRVLMTGGQMFESTIIASVSGKKQKTEYSVFAVGIDDDLNFTELIRDDFTTKASAMPTVTLGAELKSDDEGNNPYNSIFFHIKTTDAELIRYYISDSTEIAGFNEQGYSNETILSVLGDTISSSYTDVANSENGLPFSCTGLTSGTSYTLIVQAFNGEYKKIEVLTQSTQAVPRVESELFEKLPGEWSATMIGLDSKGEKDSTYNFDVTISAGPNATLAEEYRKNNLLVCEQFASFPYYSPEALVENGFPQSRANVAYGPKWFLSIAEGDVVTVPADMTRTLYSWSQAGDIFLLGTNMTEMLVAREPFPVEISDDYNTITVKSSTYNGNTYYPSACYQSSNGFIIAFAGTSEITLTRKTSSVAPLRQTIRNTTANRQRPEFILQNVGTDNPTEQLSAQPRGKVRFDVTPADEARRYESYEQPQMKQMEVPFAAFDRAEKEVQ